MDYKNVFTNCAPMELPNGLLTVFNLFNKYFSASRFQVLKTTNTNLFSSFCPVAGTRLPFLHTFFENFVYTIDMPLPIFYRILLKPTYYFKIHIVKYCSFTGYYLVTLLGFEPRTPTLKVWCSTN